MILVALVMQVVTLVAVAWMLWFVWSGLDRLLRTIILNELQLVSKISTRISTARMPTGMPGEKPPQVVETHLTGNAVRTKRTVKGGEPDSQQYQGLQRGLPITKAGVDE